MSEFARKLEDAGVTKLVFVRHASAAPPGNKAKTEYAQIHDWHRDDQLRPLTDKGKQQCKVSRVWFQEKVTNKANKVLVTSGARRASETLQLLTEEEAKGSAFGKMFGCSGDSAVATQASMDLCMALHPAGIAPKCEEFFDTLGYGPMTKFYAKDGGKEAFRDYANTVLQQLGQIVDKVGKQPGNTISSFGHAVFLNAVAVIIAEEVWAADAATIKALQELDLGECEGIILTKTGATMTFQHMKA